MQYDFGVEQVASISTLESSAPILPISKAWLKLTHSAQGSFFLMSGSYGGEKVSVVSEPGPRSVVKHTKTASRAKPGPGPVDGLVFLWKDNIDANQFVDYRNVKHDVRVIAAGGSRFGPAGQMR